VSRDGVVRSPSVGRVIEVLVRVGDAVGVGQEVAVVESMKVEIPVAAAEGGQVATVLVVAGDPVRAGDVLLTLAGARNDKEGV
jgi:acetyl-CoA carboxylase biotin carboxyl carrier protein